MSEFDEIQLDEEVDDDNDYGNSINFGLPLERGTSLKAHVKEVIRSLPVEAQSYAPLVVSAVRRIAPRTHWDTAASDAVTFLGEAYANWQTDPSKFDKKQFSVYVKKTVEGKLKNSLYRRPRRQPHEMDVWLKEDEENERRRAEMLASWTDKGLKHLRKSGSDIPDRLEKLRSVSDYTERLVEILVQDRHHLEARQSLVMEYMYAKTPVADIALELRISTGRVSQIHVEAIAQCFTHFAQQVEANLKLERRVRPIDGAVRQKEQEQIETRLAQTLVSCKDTALAFLRASGSNVPERLEKLRRVQDYSDHLVDILVANICYLPAREAYVMKRVCDQSASVDIAQELGITIEQVNAISIQAIARCFEHYALRLEGVNNRDIAYLSAAEEIMNDPKRSQLARCDIPLVTRRIAAQIAVSTWLRWDAKLKRFIRNGVVTKNAETNRLFDFKVSVSNGRREVGDHEDPWAPDYDDDAIDCRVDAITIDREDTDDGEDIDGEDTYGGDNDDDYVDMFDGMAERDFYNEQEYGYDHND